MHVCKINSHNMNSTYMSGLQKYCNILGQSVNINLRIYIRCKANTIIDKSIAHALHSGYSCWVGVVFHDGPDKKIWHFSIRCKKTRAKALVFSYIGVKKWHSMYVHWNDLKILFAFCFTNFILIQLDLICHFSVINK